MSLLISLYPFLSVISLSFAFFFAARASKQLKPLQALFLFQLIGIPLFIFIAPLNNTPLKVSMIAPIAAIGVFAMLSLLLYFYALKVGNVSIVTPISDSYAIVTMVLAVVFLHESLTVYKILGTALMIVGLFLLSVNFEEIKNKVSANKGIMPALLFSVGSGVYFFWVTIISREAGWFYTTLGIRIFISITAFILLLVTRQNIKEVFKVSYKWLIPGALLDVIGFCLYNISIAKLETSYVTLVISAQSLIVVTLSVIFLKERLTKLQLIGIILGFASLILLQFS